MSELKKCPFCGGEAVLCNSGNYSETTFYWIYCKECGCKQPSSIHLESVTKAWNNRKPVDDVLERLEELKKAEYDDSDEEPEFTDVEEWFDEGESSGKFKAYNNAINIIKEELM